jgi:sporulation protein YlmC with PRC-barrel domain
MKKTIKKSACSVALVCAALATPAWAADDAQSASDAQRQNPVPPSTTDSQRRDSSSSSSSSTSGASDYQHQTGTSTSTSGRQSQYDTTGTTAGEHRQVGSPSNINKASTLVGMEVRNQADEKLGKIDDIVLDLESGRVSYAVLNTGGLFRSKMVAVPSNAFTISADQKYLILHADKSRLETAKGFEKDNWPSVSNPEWGADTFWDKNPSSSTDRWSTGSDRLNTTPSDQRSQQPSSSDPLTNERK